MPTRGTHSMLERRGGATSTLIHSVAQGECCGTQWRWREQRQLIAQRQRLCSKMGERGCVVTPHRSSTRMVRMKMGSPPSNSRLEGDGLVYLTTRACRFDQQKRPRSGATMMIRLKSGCVCLRMWMRVLLVMEEEEEEEECYATKCAGRGATPWLLLPLPLARGCGGRPRSSAPVSGSWCGCNSSFASCAARAS